MERKTAIRLGFNVLALLLVALFSVRVLWDMSAGQLNRGFTARLEAEYGSLPIPSPFSSPPRRPMRTGWPPSGSPFPGAWAITP